MKNTLLTKEGFEKLTKQKENLLNIRPEAVGELKRAREMGDLSENGFYKGARAKLSQIDRELRKITYLLKNVKIIEKSKDTEKTSIGDTVTIEGEGNILHLTIVGEEEANPKEKKISYLSPIGRGLLGKKVGDKAEITTPKGKISYLVKKIE